MVTEASTLDGAGHAAVRDLAADAPIHVAAPDGAAARHGDRVTADPGRARAKAPAAVGGQAGRGPARSVSGTRGW